MKNGVDFIAELNFLPSENGGRKNAAASGYRPHVQFEHYPEYLTSGQQQYIGQNEVNPGESTLAEISILSTDYFSKRLYEGKCFKFFEGGTLVGVGEILEIVNPSLKMDNPVKEGFLNFNLYPEDIVLKVKQDFRNENHDVIRFFQSFLMEMGEVASPRVLRAVIYLAKGNIDQLDGYMKTACIDIRDILYQAEYDKNADSELIRTRDFNQPFGKENL